MQPSSRSRTLISVLVIVIVLSGLICGPGGLHSGMDFDCPVVLFPFSPILDLTWYGPFPNQVTDPFSASYFPAAPDRAPPSIQTVLSV
jgi:hypothetical protein